MASGKPLLLSKGVWDLSDWTTLDTTGALRIIGGGASRDDVVVRGAGDRSGVGINALHSLSLENLTLQDWNKPWRLTPGSQTADIDLVRLNRIYFKDCIYWGYLQHNGVASNQRLSAVEMDWIDGDCAGIADEAQTWGMWLYGQIGRGVFDHIYGRDLNGTGLWVGAEDKAAQLETKLIQIGRVQFENLIGPSADEDVNGVSIRASLIQANEIIVSACKKHDTLADPESPNIVEGQEGVYLKGYKAQIGSIIADRCRGEAAVALKGQAYAADVAEEENPAIYQPAADLWQIDRVLTIADEASAYSAGVEVKGVNGTLANVTTHRARNFAVRALGPTSRLAIRGLHAIDTVGTHAVHITQGAGNIDLSDFNVDGLTGEQDPSGRVYAVDVTSTAGVKSADIAIRGGRFRIAAENVTTDKVYAVRLSALGDGAGIDRVEISHNNFRQVASTTALGNIMVRVETSGSGYIDELTIDRNVYPGRSSTFSIGQLIEKASGSNVGNSVIRDGPYASTTARLSAQSDPQNQFKSLGLLMLNADNNVLYMATGRAASAAWHPIHLPIGDVSGDIAPT